MKGVRKVITSKKGIKFKIELPNSCSVHVSTNCIPSWIGQVHIITALQDDLGLEFSRNVVIAGDSFMEYYLGSHTYEEVENTLKNYQS